MILGEVNHTGEKLWNTLRIAHPRIGYLVGNPAFFQKLDFEDVSSQTFVNVHQTMQTFVNVY